MKKANLSYIKKDPYFNELLKSIGKKLYELRRKKNEKLEAMAINLGICHSTISKVENGNYHCLSLVLLMTFANYFQVSIEELLDLNL